jgi:hypothetical protein
MTLLLLLRAAGGSLILLSLFHMVLWRALHWSDEVEKLSPLNARVFAVHTFFIAFVLAALGLLSLLEPELLLAPSRLARLLLIGVVVFWLVRLALQVTVFDRAMRQGWTRSPVVRIGALFAWAAYVAIYGAALFSQFGPAGAPCSWGRGGGWQ